MNRRTKLVTERNQLTYHARIDEEKNPYLIPALQRLFRGITAQQFLLKKLEATKSEPKWSVKAYVQPEPGMPLVADGIQKMIPSVMSTVKRWVLFVGAGLSRP